jgi:hypothetical protein
MRTSGSHDVYLCNSYYSNTSKIHEQREKYLSTQVPAYLPRVIIEGSGTSSNCQFMHLAPRTRVYPLNPLKTTVTTEHPGKLEMRCMVDSYGTLFNFPWRLSLTGLTL